MFGLLVSLGRDWQAILPGMALGALCLIELTGRGQGQGSLSFSLSPPLSPSLTPSLVEPFSLTPSPSLVEPFAAQPLFAGHVIALFRPCNVTCALLFGAGTGVEMFQRSAPPREGHDGHGRGQQRAYGGDGAD